jgi:hypothetical protein
MKNRLLRKMERLSHKTEVWGEALETLSEDLVRQNIGRIKFETVMAENLGRFLVWRVPESLAMRTFLNR